MSSPSTHRARTLRIVVQLPDLFSLTLRSNRELSVVVYGNTQNTSNAHVVDVYLQQNSFEDNTGNKAGAVFSRAADTTIYLTDNEFERNSAGDVNGGAIVCSNLAPINASILVFQGAKSTFSGNEPRNIGTGELYVHLSDPRFTASERVLR